MGQLANLYHSLRDARELAGRHYPSGLNSHFDSRAESIAGLLQESRSRVEAARLDLDCDEREEIITGNSAREFIPPAEHSPSRAILMVHGLTDAPYVFFDLARHFRDRGFHVLVIPLPGHGTRPGDLLETRWQDWWLAHRHAVDLLCARFDQVYLAGFSLGAALNIYQALQDERIKGLFLFAPALRIRRLARLACPLAGMGRRYPRFGWLDLQPDGDFFKYESITQNSICQVHRLIEALHRLLPLTELRLPVFVAASEDDATIDSGAILEWFATLPEQRRMLYYSAGHPEVPDDVRRVHCQFPQQKINSFSHTSLLQSPDNPHYGAQGRYRFCTHYYRLAPEKYRRCKAAGEDCLGEMFAETRDCQVIRRLTYNPLFAPLLDEIDGFLDMTA